MTGSRTARPSTSLAPALATPSLIGPAELEDEYVAMLIEKGSSFRSRDPREGEEFEKAALAEMADELGIRVMSEAEVEAAPVSTLARGAGAGCGVRGAR